MDNRTNLLDCALNLFAARGYDAVGVQEIVEAAGVTKPTLYHYFVNKRGLLDVLLQSGFERLLDEVWGWANAVETRAVDIRIAELRKALGEDPAHPRYIQTVIGEGYVFVGPVTGRNT